MSLNWNLSRCKHKDELLSDEQWTRTEAIILYTMPLGMSGIKDATEAVEFYERYLILSRSLRCEPTHTLAHIMKYIGLSVNVIRETRTKFVNRIMRNTAAEWTALAAKQAATEAEQLEPTKAAV